MNEIRVTRDDHGCFEVWDGDRTTGPLCMGEMIETVFKLLVPETPGPRYPMKTEAEWAARAAR